MYKNETINVSRFKSRIFSLMVKLPFRWSHILGSILFDQTWILGFIWKKVQNRSLLRMEHMIYVKDFYLDQRRVKAFAEILTIKVSIWLSRYGKKFRRSWLIINFLELLAFCDHNLEARTAIFCVVPDAFFHIKKLSNIMKIASIFRFKCKS